MVKLWSMVRLGTNDWHAENSLKTPKHFRRIVEWCVPARHWQLLDTSATVLQRLSLQDPQFLDSIILRWQEQQRSPTSTIVSLYIDNNLLPTLVSIYSDSCLSAATAELHEITIWPYHPTCLSYFDAILDCLCETTFNFSRQRPSQSHDPSPATAMSCFVNSELCRDNMNNCRNVSDIA